MACITHHTYTDTVTHTCMLTYYSHTIQHECVTRTHTHIRTHVLTLSHAPVTYRKVVSNSGGAGSSGTPRICGDGWWCVWLVHPTSILGMRRATGHPIELSNSALPALNSQQPSSTAARGASVGVVSFSTLMPGGPLPWLLLWLLLSCNCAWSGTCVSE